MSGDFDINEAEQIRKAIGGDRDALDWLLLMHRDVVEAFFQSKLNREGTPRFELDDMVQETFRSACQEIGNFVPDGEDAFPRWLMTMARNRFVDFTRVNRSDKRGGGRRPVSLVESDQHSVADLLSELIQHDRTPSRSAMRHEALASLKSAIELLAPEYAQVIRLRRLEGLSARDVAVRMNRSETAVNTLCHRAIHALREIMGSRSRHVS